MYTQRTNDFKFSDTISINFFLGVRTLGHAIFYIVSFAKN